MSDDIINLKNQNCEVQETKMWYKTTKGIFALVGGLVVSVLVLIYMTAKGNFNSPKSTAGSYKTTNNSSDPVFFDFLTPKTYENQLISFDPKSKTLTNWGPVRNTFAVPFVQNESSVILKSDDMKKLLSLDSSKGPETEPLELVTADDSDRIINFAVSLDGKLIVFKTNQGILKSVEYNDKTKTWDDPKLLLDNMDDLISSLAVSYDKKSVFYIDSSSPNLCEIKIDSPSKNVACRPYGNNSKLLKISPDAQLVAYIDEKAEKIIVVDRETENLKSEFSCKQIFYLSIQKWTDDGFYAFVKEKSTQIVYYKLYKFTYQDGNEGIVEPLKDKNGNHIVSGY